MNFLYLDCIPNNIVAIETLVDFSLFTLNVTNQHKHYLKRYEFENSNLKIESVEELLNQVFYI